MNKPHIFISYRRADSRSMAHRIHDALSEVFGKDHVFIDVDDISVGADFRSFLYDEIRKSDIVLVLIGGQWAQIMRKGLGNKEDFVRIELLAALEMQKLVIPILIGNTPMPDKKSLPPEIRDDFVYLNAKQIDDASDFKRDMERLIPQLQGWESIPITPRMVNAGASQGSSSKGYLWGMGLFALIVFVLLAIIAWQTDLFAINTNSTDVVSQTATSSEIMPTEEAEETVEIVPTETDSPTVTPTILATPNGGGSRFVFARGTSDESVGDEIVLLDFDFDSNNGSSIQLTNDDFDDGNPVWSPDGTRIAYQSFRRTAWRIVIMAADGSANTLLTSADQNRVQPAWSPDGTHIAYTRGSLGGREIAIWDLETGNESIITTSEWDAFSPVWLDENQIVYITDNPGHNRVNYVFTNTGVMREGVSLGGNVTQFSISPDGMSLVYALDIARSDSENQHDIYVLSLETSQEGETSQAQNITNNTTIIHNYPSWSPDGTQIVYMTDIDGNNEIYIMNADGSNPRRLTNTTLWEWNPQWQASASTSE